MCLFIYRLFTCFLPISAAAQRSWVRAVSARTSTFRQSPRSCAVRALCTQETSSSRSTPTSSASTSRFTFAAEKRKVCHCGGDCCLLFGINIMKSEERVFLKRMIKIDFFPVLFSFFLFFPFWRIYLYFKKCFLGNESPIFMPRGLLQGIANIIGICCQYGVSVLTIPIPLLSESAVALDDAIIAKQVCPHTLLNSTRCCCCSHRSFWRFALLLLLLLLFDFDLLLFYLIYNLGFAVIGLWYFLLLFTLSMGFCSIIHFFLLFHFLKKIFFFPHSFILLFCLSFLCIFLLYTSLYSPSLYSPPCVHVRSARLCLVCCVASSPSARRRHCTPSASPSPSTPTGHSSDRWRRTHSSSRNEWRWERICVN